MNRISHIFDSNTDSIIEITSDFKLAKSMPSATLLMELFFSDSTQKSELPKKLKLFLKTNFERQNIDSSIEQTIAASFSKYSRKLIVIAFRNRSSDSITVVLKEDPIAKVRYDKMLQKMTKRQRDVYHLIADGTTNINAIAKTLGISVRTVEEHRRFVKRIMKNEVPD